MNETFVFVNKYTGEQVQRTAGNEEFARWEGDTYLHPYEWRVSTVIVPSYALHKDGTKEYFNRYTYYNPDGTIAGHENLPIEQ